MSRTTHSLRNFIMSTFGAILTILFNFISRTVLIKTLGSDYIGINGLFTNVLSMLSLADLGVGTAILYNLYKPIEDKDFHRITVLMDFYKKLYRVIGLVIFVLGVCLIPFLPNIIKDYDRLRQLNINAVLLFLLFLFRTTSSYWFFAYKTALVKAHQKEYVLKPIEFVFLLAMNILQILVLILFKNYIFFIVVSIVMQLIQNIVCALKTEKMYPYIKEKTPDRLEKSERKEIFKNCYALFLYKINTVVTNATGNIVLSAFLGITSVGLYSNYTLIVTAIRSVVSKVYVAMTASLGNLHAEGDVKHEEKIFNTVNFITFIMYGIAAIGMAIVCNDFVNVWIGNKYLISPMEIPGTGFSVSFPLLLGIEIYVLGINLFLSYFRNSMGLFQQGKYRPIATIIINLAVSVFLVTKIGISGVVIGTIVSALATYIWYDPMIIYRHTFKTSTKEYWIKNLKYAVAVCVAGVISYKLCDVVNGNGIIFVILHGIICVLTSVAVFTAAFFRTEEFKYLSTMVKNLVKRKIK
ncbi:MAG: hypothetical protein J6C82_05495 [Clostridia bacterium]|nr:hypothetical protein [Clostridia bacterium]